LLIGALPRLCGFAKRPAARFVAAFVAE
jgi:hypothetical protein